MNKANRYPSSWSTKITVIFQFYIMMIFYFSPAFFWREGNYFSIFLCYLSSKAMVVNELELKSVPQSLAGEFQGQPQA